MKQSEDEIKIFLSIMDANPIDWKSCVGDKSIFMEYSYLEALESSIISGMRFRYALLYQNGNPVAAIQFQVVDLSNNDLGGALNLDNYGGIPSHLAGPLNRLLFSCRKNKKPVLLSCGSLLSSGEHGIMVKKPADLRWTVSQLPRVRKMIIDQLEDSKVICELVKDFYSDSNQRISSTLGRSYFQVNTDPEMVVEIPESWNNFDDYLAAFSSKYRVRANSIRKNFQSVQSVRLMVHDIEAHRSEIDSLYEFVYRKAPVRLFRLTTDYFRSLADTLGDRFIFTAFFKDGQMIAFSSAIRNADILEAHYIGIDYSLNKDLCIYQNILYHFIETGISSGVKKIFMGRTALEIKSTVGAVPRPLHSYMHFSGRILNMLARTIAASSTPAAWVQRQPFKTT